MKISQFVRQSPHIQILQAAMEIQKQAKRRLPKNLSFFQGLVLCAIYFEKPESGSVSDLANSLGLSKSLMSHTISSLEANGLVKRRVDNQDNRIWMISLTRAGEKICPDVIGFFHGMQDQFESKSNSRQRERFLGTLGSLF